MIVVLLACTAGKDSGSVAPTLADVQAEVFDASCAFSSCHGVADGAGELDLRPGSSHGELVGVPSSAADGETLVVAGDSAASYLVKKCTPTAGIVGEGMPNAAGLAAEQLDLLAAWIDAGAADD